MHRTLSALLACALLLGAHAALAQQPPVAPYDEVTAWGPVPADAGNEWEPARVDTDAQGRVYVLRRSSPSIFVLEPSGRVLRSFADRMFVWAHGMHVDRKGNVWATDCSIGAGSVAYLRKPDPEALAAGHGHQVYKFSPKGTLLMTLGTGGRPGTGPGQFHCPSDVIVAKDGHVFVADGHGGDMTHARILKFSKGGTLVKTWGTRGKGPGEFAAPHALAFDSRGRLFVGDRGNKRIQVFDQDGRFIEQFTAFGDPSGIAITADDTMFVTDTGPKVIYVGSAKTGQVTGVIPGVWAEGIAADAAGNVYAGEVHKHNWRKFTRRR